MSEGVIPPNLHFRHGDEGIELNIVRQPTATNALNLALSNSFGFGGTNASIVMQRSPRT
jgi:3-oxoacyl-[acyl-carrier-protein] synthase II